MHFLRSDILEPQKHLCYFWSMSEFNINIKVDHFGWWFGDDLFFQYEVTMNLRPSVCNFHKFPPLDVDTVDG